MDRIKLTYTEHSAKIFRFAGLFVPAVLLTYGIFIKIDIIRVYHPMDITGMIMLCFWWLCMSVINFLVPSTSRQDMALRLIAYHLLVGAYLILVSGITSAFVGCWPLLMLASYIYFSGLGLQISVLAFAATVSIDILVWGSTSPSIATPNLIALVVIFIIGMITIDIFKTQETDKFELDRTKAEEKLQRDRIFTIINNMTDAIFSTDKDGFIRLYNAASLNLLDTNENLIGKHLDDILVLKNQKDHKISLFKAIVKSRTVIKRDDLSYDIDEDEKMRLEITYSPIRSSYSRSKKAERYDGHIIILRDITKAKSLEEERDEFISVVSHELRTPITIAEGTLSNTQLMLSHPDSTPSMIKDSINLAHDQILFLANMVNDLSTLSRAERGLGSDSEDIDIEDMAKKMLAKYQDDANKKNLHFDIDIEPKLGIVRTSRLYLEELLQNFITNSIKYTKEGSVTLIIKRKNDTVSFAVKDTGIGISKSDQAKVFDKFYRSEDYRTRETGGTGLGLYVAAKLAHKINTKIHLSSRLNFGSTFSFDLKDNKEPAVK